ncbi:MAG: 2Fe-2S iron-sulfur cluster binding domain-containing protein [Candidatus Thiodiazotropha sp. (ex Dulcina madagascariensis)]|nr:2Fe-2S iron-sulfur cluster binding domain-containing protein [Candidatus Thiodiazotropha sp. (ex Epidulcina cf. delphinae)]MCU7924136.1 2Fe-2S iron-sulfur cluster binding domain-containing protein [Candidatus Thiodiazotropha sp. (ex Dulcina madagascariensis)]MCU7927122.1 2Fe-2S iron-sulfur cluster binding domain-containing protein [Candidatus Thiodiazotropha sp. (ex Dulcina madagascariensis)]MCU7937314.1 2Fe-2S iron-sulfur cluster binding domain-containing protein [Candidatus Thiodiazotropha 
MAVIRYAGRSFSVAEGESVLETLLSANYEIPNSCRAGVCQSCVMQLVDGEIDPSAQKGLKDSWQAQDLFLACRCHPDQDLEIRLPAVDHIRVGCQVTGHDRLSGGILRLRLRPESQFDYRPGQYVTLWRDTTLGRSYSLASVPVLDGDELEFHIKRFSNGRLSSWLCDCVNVGDRIALQGPGGYCFYTGNDAEQDLLLAGAGTGLAPLYGILRDALQRGHTGQIHLYHGAVDIEGLYLHETLQELAATHQNLHYHPCTLNEPPGRCHDVRVENLNQLLSRERSGLQGWKVYLCGPDEFVKKQRQHCFLAGAGLKDIYADAFINHSQP